MSVPENKTTSTNKIAERANEAENWFTQRPMITQFVIAVIGMVVAVILIYTSPQVLVGVLIGAAMVQLAGGSWVMQRKQENATSTAQAQPAGKL